MIGSWIGSFPRRRLSNSGKRRLCPSTPRIGSARSLSSATDLTRISTQPESSTPDLVFIAGKQGVAYLVNRTTMGGLAHGGPIEGVYSGCLFGTCSGGGPKVFSAAAYWDGGSSGRLILVPGRGRQPAGCQGNGGVVALGLGTAPMTRKSTFRVRWCGDRERAVRGQSPANAPAAPACGAINDPGMIERRARLNEVANEPAAR